MTVTVSYDRRDVPVTVPDERVLAVLEPNEVPVGDPVRTIADAIAAPIGSSSLDHFLSGGRRVLVLVNDATRPTPTPAILDALDRYLAGCDVTFLVATGAHRAPTEDEYRQIFGRHWQRVAPRVMAHDSRDDAAMVTLGRSKNGTEIVLNRLVTACDRIISTGSVEPHYFAGYTGGRKSFFPGIAAYRTIEQNHRLAMRPRAESLSLHGNPVNEDMMDALSLIPTPIFSVQTVLDRNQAVYAAAAGNIRDSFEAAVKRAEEVFVVKVKERADIVVSVVRYPMDIDLYQSQKGIDNGKLVLADGGILILVSSCRDGAGGKAFIDLLSSSSSPEEALRRIDAGYRLGYHKAAKMAQVFLRAGVWAVTRLDPVLVRSAFMTPVPSVQEAVNRALAEKGPAARIIFLLDGSVTVPLVG